MTYNTQPKEKKDCAIKSAVFIYEDFQNLKPIDVSSNLMNFRLILLEICFSFSGNVKRLIY